MFQFMLNLVQAYYDRKIHAPYPPFLISVRFISLTFACLLTLYTAVVPSHHLSFGSKFVASIFALHCKGDWQLLDD
jgi:hypothetical protein